MTRWRERVDTRAVVGAEGSGIGGVSRDGATRLRGDLLASGLTCSAARCSRFMSVLMLPSRKGGDLWAGMWALLCGLDAMPRRL